ncbi:uncharacterized protein LOC144598295 [Rhinoraja longicauda]
MADNEHGHIDPAWWLQDEGHFLLPLNGKVIYQHNQRAKAPVTAQRMETLFKNVLEDNPVDVHQLFFNTQSSVYDSSDEDGAFEDGFESNEDGEQRYTGTFCGLRRNFLCEPQLALRPIPDYNCTKLNPYRGTAEEADRIGQQLVNEEEQTKRKAERRRLKKKRQKERRRQQKLENGNRSEGESEESVNAKPVLSHCEGRVDRGRDCGDLDGDINCDAATSPEHVLEGNKPGVASRILPSVRVAAAKDSKVKRERQAGGVIATDRSLSQSEDEWDLSSSFVSKAANQIKRKLNIKPKAEKKEMEKKKAEKKPEPPVDSTALNDKIRELAEQGNSMVNEGRYEDAVAYFTEAITYDPKEYRLFGNRSYCYERLQQYSRALSDAHTALTLNPSWPKGYFRKARALAGVKKYAEAIEAFQQVLLIDNSCEDAEFELLQVQIKLMMERGFTQQQCEETLKVCGSFEQALEALSSSAPRAGAGPASASASASLSNTDDKGFIQVKKHSTHNKHKAPAPVPTQPPSKLFPVWIGNITTRITEDSLRVMFERYMRRE